MGTRTISQINADSLDCELDRLCRRADQMFIQTRDARWQKAYFAINAARSPARSMMHDDDVRATV